MQSLVLLKFRLLFHYKNRKICVEKCLYHFKGYLIIFWSKKFSLQTGVNDIMIPRKNKYNVAMDPWY